MKCIIFCVFSFILLASSSEDYNLIAKHLVVTPEEKLVLGRYTDECIKETNVDPELLKTVETGVFPDNYELKCFYKCYQSKYGALSETGEYDLTKLRTQLLGEPMNIAQYCCDTMHDDDLCKMAYSVYSCFIKGVLLLKPKTEKL